MALQDLDLTETATGYELSAPTEALLVRMKNRFLVQFLSKREDNRGSIFVSELAAGRIRTNSDIVLVFGLSAAEIIEHLRALNYEIYPQRAVLQRFEIIDSRRIRLVILLYTSVGTIIGDVLVDGTTA